VVATGVFTPYSTASRLFGTKPSWITNELDVLRIQSYQLYEEIYWTVDQVFKLNFRGTNDQAIYVPTGRMIVDTTNRYTSPAFAVNFTDRATGATDTPDVTSARLAFTDLFKRERFFSKFNGSKRYGLIRGDWVWHVTANPAKPQGKRISIVALDPGMYFPITDDDDVDEVVGCHLVSNITTPDGPRIHRLTYRKVTDSSGATIGITVEEGLFKLDKWEGPTDKPERVIRPVMPLPPDITALPVYHVKNFEEPGNPFGSSELRGLERIMSAVNQTISDEDLTLALQGIGMYTTDAPKPTDDEGAEVPWRLGPGRVVEVPTGTTFGRVEGVRSVLPYGDHYGRLVSAVKQASATPDIAIGSVDVQIASSGIALALQLQPLLAKAEEKTSSSRMFTIR
jgi:hypothetical protein